ncbi:hypothetical protein J6590_069301 [Homalodisca vitripennis]|nr:hypothetical protein J6590_069301 [Homalodisca vitripennis]
MQPAYMGHTVPQTMGQRPTTNRRESKKCMYFYAMAGVAITILRSRLPAIATVDGTQNLS